MDFMLGPFQTTDSSLLIGNVEGSPIGKGSSPTKKVEKKKKLSSEPNVNLPQDDETPGPYQTTDSSLLIGNFEGSPIGKGSSPTKKVKKKKKVRLEPNVNLPQDDETPGPFQTTDSTLLIGNFEGSPIGKGSSPTKKVKKKKKLRLEPNVNLPQDDETPGPFQTTDSTLLIGNFEGSPIGKGSSPTKKVEKKKKLSSEPNVNLPQDDETPGPFQTTDSTLLIGKFEGSPIGKGSSPTKKVKKKKKLRLEPNVNLPQDDETPGPFQTTDSTLLIGNFKGSPIGKGSSPTKKVEKKKKLSSEPNVNLPQDDETPGPFQTTDSTLLIRNFEGSPIGKGSSPTKKVEKKKKLSSEPNVNLPQDDETPGPFQITDPTLFLPTHNEDSVQASPDIILKKKKKKKERSESDVNKSLTEELLGAFQTLDHTSPGTISKKKKRKSLDKDHDGMPLFKDSEVLLPVHNDPSHIDTGSHSVKKVKKKKRKHANHDETEQHKKKQKKSHDCVTPVTVDMVSSEPTAAAFTGLIIPSEEEQTSRESIPSLKLPKRIKILDKSYVGGEDRGAWSQEETAILMNNLGTFLKENNQYDATLLLRYHMEDCEKKSELKRFIRKTRFYETLVEGIDRPPSSIFNHIYKLVVSTHLTPANEKTVSDLVCGDNVEIIAEKMKSPAPKHKGALKKQQKQSNVAKKWTQEEVDRFKKFITENVDWKRKKVPWTKIVKHMQTKSAQNCTGKWKRICWELPVDGRQQPTFTDLHKLQLLQTIKDQQVTSEESIRWKKVSKELQRRWDHKVLRYYWFCVKKQVPRRLHKNYQDLWEHLDAKYIPILEQKVKAAQKRRGILRNRLRMLTGKVARLRSTIELSEKRFSTTLPLEDEPQTQ